jgi:hypothetical protein
MRIKNLDKPRRGLTLQVAERVHAHRKSIR